LLEKFTDIETICSQDDKMRKLTPLGRTQAELTGKRLGEMQKGINKAFGPCSFKIIRSSDMLRAKETAEIIAKHLEGVEVAAPDELLNEALPAPIIPARPGILDVYVPRARGR
jgi:serine/threonine-protein phosphatase PGAM5